MARQLAKHGSPSLGTVPRWRRPVSCRGTAVPRPLSPLSAPLPPPALPSQTGSTRKPAVKPPRTTRGPVLLRYFRLHPTSPPAACRLRRSTKNSSVSGCTGVRSVARRRSGTARSRSNSTVGLQVGIRRWSLRAAAFVPEALLAPKHAGENILRSPNCRRTHPNSI